MWKGAKRQMICYKDKTFCDYTDCNKFKGCDRAYTDDVLKEAKEWWKRNDPPVMFYISEPECYEEGAADE